jgi:hypothetical protein
MLNVRSIFAAALLASAPAFAEINTEWAYHDDNDGTDDRAGEGVPGQAVMFLGNAKVSIPDAEPVTLYVLTVNQFAGDADEQVFARWWNGKEEKWIMGSWMTNVYVGTGDNDAGRFHGLPNDQSVMCDIWKIEVSPDLTLPGENFYVIQLKGWANDASTGEAYLLRDSADGSKNNNVGQSVTTGSYFGHDWSVTITP